MLTKKLAKAVGILNKVKTYLNKPILLSLYCTFFHSQLHYGLLIWSSTFHSYYNKIITLHNKPIKNVCGGKWSDRTIPYYSKLKVLKLQDLIQLETIFVFKFENQKLPSTFNNFFTSLNSNLEIQNCKQILFTLFQI